jgi:hypothetical protein
MSVKTANGNYAFADGQETPDFFIPLVAGAPLVLTNALQADGFVNADNSYIYEADLLGVRQVRLTGIIKTVSASANTPRLQLRYSPTATQTVASFLQLGATSQVQISMFTGQLYADTGWLDIAQGARRNSVFLGLFNIGGDGAADPVVNSVIAHFR